MGYKLSGFRTLGGVEIDPDMMHLYRKNLNPTHSFMMPIQEFRHRPLSELTLYNLDVLDGSPPCSSFSMAGSREDAWGESKEFREGQQKQVLDDLFFHFISVAKWLAPKFIVAENVKGLLTGKARGYVKEIFQKMREAGYIPQLFLLNSSSMGVPQSRERSFFLGRREDLNLPPIRLSFTEKPITLGDAIRGRDGRTGKYLTRLMLQEWQRTPYGKSSEKYFQLVRPRLDLPCPTITSQVQDAGATVCHPMEPRKFSTEELVRIQTFPDDYQFLGMNAGYVMGMSVPPLMMQRVSREILRQWILPLRASSDEKPS